MLAWCTFLDKKERIKTACRGSDRFYHVLPFFSESIESIQQNKTFYMVCEAKWGNVETKTMLACCTLTDNQRESRLHEEAAIDFIMYCHFFRKYRIHSTEHNILVGLWGQMVQLRRKNNASLLYFLGQKRENQDCKQRQRPILSCIAIFFRKYRKHSTEQNILHGLWGQMG